MREGVGSVVIIFGSYCVVEATSGQRQTVVGTLLIYKHILLPPCTKHLVNIFYLLCNFPGRIPHITQYLIGYLIIDYRTVGIFKVNLPGLVHYLTFEDLTNQMFNLMRENKEERNDSL